MSTTVQPASFPLRVARTLAWWLRATRLCLAILIEAIFSLAQFAVFPLRRRRERARIAAIIQGKPALLLAGLGVSLALLVAGCGSSQPMPGSSFEYQMNQLLDSTRDLIDMSDARASLEEDLYSMAEMEPMSELLWDLEQVFTDPGARASLESDLAEFGDPELGAFAETCEMLGW